MIATNLAGFEDLPQTLPHYCLESFRRHKKSDALSIKVGDTWQRISGQEVIDRVKRLALGLASLGLKPGERVAVMSENRPEWSLIDLALLCLRAVNVPIYTTQAVDQIRYILENSGAKMLFISGKKLFKHAAEAIKSVESLEKIVFFDSNDATDNVLGITLTSILEAGEKADASDFDTMLANVKPDDLATIIYTSGTTGEPKGVMLTNESFVSNVVAISKGLPIMS